MNDKELERFKANVKGQYLAIKNARETEQKLKGKTGGLPPSRGFFDRFFFKMSVDLGLKGVATAQRKRAAAVDIISNAEISAAICSGWVNDGRNIGDDELVDHVVNAILSPQIRLKHSISLDDELIGACCDEISRLGIDSYCVSVRSHSTSEP